MLIPFQGHLRVHHNRIGAQPEEKERRATIKSSVVSRPDASNTISHGGSNGVYKPRREREHDRAQSSQLQPHSIITSPEVSIPDKQSRHSEHDLAQQYDSSKTSYSLYFEPRFVPLTSNDELDWLFDGTLYDNPTTEMQSLILPGIGTSHSLPARTPPQTHDIAVDQQASPLCAWRVCNAMSEAHRLELLLAMRDSFDHKGLTSAVFSLDNLKAGVHHFSKYVAREYSFFHPRLLFPEPDELIHLHAHYGEEAPPQLAWTIITLGWMLLPEQKGREEYVEISRKIQRAIRISIMTTITTTPSPPLWVIQTLFLNLVYARYHGDAEDSGTAPLLHGVLVSLVRRLETIPPPKTNTAPDLNLDYSHWYQWIKAESTKRILIQTFVLDVQQSVLFGEKSSMSPFELNLTLPSTEAAWTADTLQSWNDVLRQSPLEPPLFLNMLKQFWNIPITRAVASPIMAQPSDARVVLHGVISIASESWRRQQDSTPSIATTTAITDTAQTLGARTIASFRKWIVWWNGDAKHFRVQGFNWASCDCFYRLAQTLCEVTANDLQIAAGRDSLHGKTITSIDYARARRRIRTWASSSTTITAVSEAARVVSDYLYSQQDPSVHCRHCRWSLYLAGLVLWNYVFTTQNKVVRLPQPTFGPEYASVSHALNILISPESVEHPQVDLGVVAQLLSTISKILKQQETGIIDEALGVLGRICNSTGPAASSL